MLSKIAVYAVSVSSGLSVAVPKYNLPNALAASFKPWTLVGVPTGAEVVGLDEGGGGGAVVGELVGTDVGTCA